MKTLRLLSITIFIICFFPMFQYCSNEEIEKKALKQEHAIPNDTEDDTFELIKKTTRKGQEAFKKEVRKLQKEYTANTYEVASDGLENGLNLSSLITAFLVGSVVVVVAVFTQKSVLSFLLACINLILLIAFAVSLLKDGAEISQFKYGYYLLLLNCIALVYFSFYEFKKQAQSKS